MITTAPAALAKTQSLRETRFARNSLPARRAMKLPPPTFRIILALAGASLVLWGAKGEVLNVPGMSVINVFDINRTASWMMVIAAVATFGLAWLRPAIFAWLAWSVAMGALAWMLYEVWVDVRYLSENYAAMREEGFQAPDLQKIIQDTTILPGAVAILSGLVIQAVALCLKRKPAGEEKRV
jgi:hypothetical protein